MTIKIFSDKVELTRFAANQFFTQAQQAVKLRGRFLVTLSGGGTPLSLFQLLTQQPYRQQVPWTQTLVFWGDERCVHPDDPDSNYRQAKETLLDHVPLPKDNIHRIHGELTPEIAAHDYAERLQSFAHSGLAWPRFDLVLLGLGSDGHTASLFPGSSPKDTKSTLVATANYQGRPAHRVTLTPSVFNTAREIMFLVTGTDKANALAAVLGGAYEPVRWPAQRIQPIEGKVIWLADTAAANQLE
jgi:6-phosphogluconolactonase